VTSGEHIRGRDLDQVNMTLMNEVGSEIELSGNMGNLRASIDTVAVVSL
jgi:hypothetical protein